MKLINGRRYLSYTYCKLKEIPKGGKKGSSQEWLTRHINDPYVSKAKIENYRCRSAFKLLEINDKVKFLKPGYRVLDCGAAPGSWTQVAVKLVNSLGLDKKSPQGLVISVDKLPIYPIDGAKILGRCDFTNVNFQKELIRILNNDLLDVVLSDMAPNATGVKDMDHDLITELANSVIRFAVCHSKQGASCIIKIWDGRNRSLLEQNLLRFYKSTKIIKPPSSRSDSAEMFLLAQNFKGLQKDENSDTNR